MRAPFAAAAIAGFVGFALLGFITALVGSFLAKGLSDHSHQTAGVASCLVFAAAALAQVGAGRLSNHRASLLGLAVAPIGLGLITAALPARSLTLFVVGALVSGAGVGFAFRAAIVSITTRAPDERRGEVLATFFVIAYIGLTVPVVGTGVLVTDAHCSSRRSRSRSSSRSWPRSRAAFCCGYRAALHVDCRSPSEGFGRSKSPILQRKPSLDGEDAPRRRNGRGLGSIERALGRRRS
jgi:MFS family permease